MKDDLLYIDHILSSIEKIIQYTDGIYRDDFVKNELIQDAVIRNIEIIGEATKMISNDFKKVYHEIPWKEMAGMRDKLIHDYMGVDITVIWATIENDLPMLRTLLLKIEK
jgi:uncharacterized protein with HEPN domain